LKLKKTNSLVVAFEQNLQESKKNFIAKPNPLELRKRPLLVVLNQI